VVQGQADLLECDRPTRCDPGEVIARIVTHRVEGGKHRLSHSLVTFVHVAEQIAPTTLPDSSFQ
jgi:hypothetical protein